MANLNRKVAVPAEEIDRQREFMLLVHDISEARFLSQGNYPKALVRTYGCQGNVADGEKLKGMLEEMGYQLVDSPEGADFVLYNTCAIREHAEDRVFGNVGALKNNKRRNPSMLIGLCGCMMQQEHVAQKIKKSYPYVDLVFGTHAMHRFPELFYQALSSHCRVFEISQSDGVIAEGLPTHRDGQFKAWLPIMYGCNNFCTYCVVPYVRGRERSRQPEDILEEARELIAHGYKDITLLGQNVNSYGNDLQNGIRFPQLLQKINDLDGEFRIRFMTSHPKDCTHELIDTIARCDKVCNHIHLPVQSGNSRVLKAMNRRYTRESYLSLIEYAKQKIPNVSFTSDIIVGFPGETYEEFLQTVSLIEQVGYDSLYTFIFSPRKGTKAYDMPDPVSQEEKGKWFRELLAVQEKIGEGKYQALVGKTLRVLPEGPGKTGEGYLTGRSDSNVIVDFPGEDSLIGKFVNVTITKALNWAVHGELR